MEEKKLELKGIHSNPQQQYLYGFNAHSDLQPQKHEYCFNGKNKEIFNCFN